MTRQVPASICRATLLCEMMTESILILIVRYLFQIANVASTAHSQCVVERWRYVLECRTATPLLPLLG